MWLIPQPSCVCGIGPWIWEMIDKYSPKHLWFQNSECCWNVNTCKNGNLFTRKLKEWAAFDGQGRNVCVLLKFLKNNVHILFYFACGSYTCVAPLVISLWRTSPLGRFWKGGSSININFIDSSIFWFSEVIMVIMVYTGTKPTFFLPYRDYYIYLNAFFKWIM